MLKRARIEYLDETTCYFKMYLEHPQSAMNMNMTSLYGVVFRQTDGETLLQAETRLSKSTFIVVFIAMFFPAFGLVGILSLENNMPLVVSGLLAGIFFCFLFGFILLTIDDHRTLMKKYLYQIFDLSP